MSAPDTSQEAHALLIIRNVKAWMKRHKEECGDPNCVEPLNLLAAIGHCCGVKAHPRAGEVFAEMLQKYESECLSCSHVRN